MSSDGARERAEALVREFFPERPLQRWFTERLLDFALAFHAAEAARLPVTPEGKVVCGTCETCGHAEVLARYPNGPVMRCMNDTGWLYGYAPPQHWGCTDHEPREASDG